MKRILALAAFVATSSVAQAQPVAVTLSEWKLKMSRDTVGAGTVTFRVNNTGSVGHTFYVLGEGVAKGTRDIGPKQSATLNVTLKPGTYEVYCSMSDDSHKLAGMKGTLVVISADSATGNRKPRR
jgi:plastocyanin